MFGKKKKEAAGAVPVDREAALAQINEAFADLEKSMDGAFMKAYISGLSYMAFTLGAISNDEKNEYWQRAHDIEQEIKQRGKPVYKKKGVYQYRGWYILKDFAKDNGEGSACWCVRKSQEDDIVALDLTFNDAVRAIDKLCD